MNIQFFYMCTFILNEDGFISYGFPADETTDRMCSFKSDDNWNVCTQKTVTFTKKNRKLEYPN